MIKKLLGRSFIAIIIFLSQFQVVDCSIYRQAVVDAENSRRAAVSAVAAAAYPYNPPFRLF